jgi:hypothetical protein
MMQMSTPIPGLSLQIEVPIIVLLFTSIIHKQLNLIVTDITSLSDCHVNYRCATINLLYRKYYFFEDEELKRDIFLELEAK